MGTGEDVHTLTLLGIEKAHGQITEGALSNLLILDQDLNIKDIIFKGQVLSL